MLPKDQKLRIGEYVNALNRHDLQAYLAFYTKDCTIFDPMYPVKGHDALRKDFEDSLTAFPDMKFTLTTVVISGDTLAMEVFARGTNKGDLPGPAGPIRATSRTVEIRMAGFKRTNDQGLITEERRCYDVAGLMQQLGRMAA